MHMGGSAERMKLLPLAEAGDAEGQASTLAMLDKIDARKAQCFKVEDRERLLAVIEASYGTTAAFNRAVRAVLAKRKHRTDKMLSAKETLTPNARKFTRASLRNSVFGRVSLRRNSCEAVHMDMDIQLSSVNESARI